MEYLIEGLKKEELRNIKGGKECTGGCTGGTFVCSNLKCRPNTCETVT